MESPLRGREGGGRGWLPLGEMHREPNKLRVVCKKESSTKIKGGTKNSPELKQQYTRLAWHESNMVR